MQAYILCYHKVGPESGEGRRLNVSPATLGSHVRFFRRRGFRFVSANELSSPWRAKTICVTFDDAYLSTTQYGLPVLDEHSVPSTLYAVSSLVGRVSEWDGPGACKLADWNDLRAAQASGHEIGNHSVSHPKLGTLDEPEQTFQIAEAHERLTAEGMQPRSFCYPYGSYNSSTIKAVQTQGYKVALALDKRIASSNDPLLALPRIVVGFSDRLPMLLYKLHVRPLLRCDTEIRQ